MKAAALRRQQGFSLVEVLVTILVLLIGLLGMFGLQSRATVVEIEAYQRAQALALLKDMESRIRTNRTQFDTTFREGYADAADPTVFGTGSEVDCEGATGALREVCQWSDALLGAAETAAGSNTGAMIGARGCVLAQALPAEDAVAEFFVVVVWQGMSATADPSDGTPGDTCAGDVDYGDGLRRAVSSRVLIPKLEG